MTEPRQRSSPWTRIVLFLILTLAAYAIHYFTVTRISTWQPGYPSIVVLGTLTPPSLMRQLHFFGPALLALAFIVFAVASWRAPARLSGLARSAAAALIALLVLYSWALLWVIRVSRYVRL